MDKVELRGTGGGGATRTARRVEEEEGKGRGEQAAGRLVRGLGANVMEVVLGKVREWAVVFLSLALLKTRFRVGIWQATSAIYFSWKTFFADAPAISIY